MFDFHITHGSLSPGWYDAYIDVYYRCMNTKSEEVDQQQKNDVTKEGEVQRYSRT